MTVHLSALQGEKEDQLLRSQDLNAIIAIKNLIYHHADAFWHYALAPSSISLDQP